MMTTPESPHRRRPRTDRARADRPSRPRRHLGGRTASLTGLFLAAALIAGGCGWRNNGEKVAVFGDSIISLDDDLRGALGDYNVTQAGYFGHTTAEVMGPADELASKDFVQLILNIGSNDVLQQLPIADVDARLRALVDKFPDVECLHVVTINEHMVDGKTLEPRAEEAAAVNDVIRRIAAEQDRVEIIDWNAMAAQHLQGSPPTSTLTTDAVHPTAEGYDELHAAYNGALSSCGPLIDI